MPEFPFIAEVVIASCHDHNPSNRSFDATSPSGKTVKVWKPDGGDFSHLQLIAVGDKVKVRVLGDAKLPGQLRAQLLPRNEQPNATQTEWRRREQGSHGKLTHVEAELAEADHACLKFAWKLERRIRPSLTLAEYTRELLLGSLHPVRALWLSQQESKANG